MYSVSRAICGALVAASFGSVATPSSAADKIDAGDGKSSIEALEARFIAECNAKDVNAIMKEYAPGAALFVFDVIPPRQYAGWDAYKKDWQDTFAAFPGPVKFSIADLSVTVVGTVGYGHSIQQGHLTRKDGSAVDVVVRVTDVYRKLHGRWLIVQEHVSVPVDVDHDKPDLMSKP
jgi:ketosteroid isomerase-like protein